ncbi:hypothetical protein ES288_A04G131600v1 [Gossypium darwinii]|uniref:Uncharacterized protein n=2 Tax=Gossypium TaxID=3633 RepID=A0A5D2QXP3_GOSTO|nr:hypothetical protein ES288_A04G131600v1 [Gossypium darwinii]TYI33417.1 hypothetical protein ES332_A04G131500v1 [Gossypium tomentosum]
MQMPYLSPSIIIIYCFSYYYPLPKSPSGSQDPGIFELLGGMQSLLPQKKMSLKSSVKIDFYKRPFKRPPSRLLDTSRR